MNRNQQPLEAIIRINESMQQKFSTALDNFNDQIEKQKSILAEQFN